MHTMPGARAHYRREFLRFLAGSPFAAAIAAELPAFAWPAFAGQAPEKRDAGQPGGLIKNAAEAADVFDFEEVAHRRIQPGHWAYMSSGVDDDATLRANREAFAHIRLRPNRLVDVSRVDSRIEVFGTAWDAPIFLSPTGGHRAYDPEGEIGTARAVKAKGAFMMLSTMASTGVEDVAAALGRPPWYQLYAQSTWEVTEKLVKRAEAAGCPVIALTIDGGGGRNLETYQRLRRPYMNQCAACHEGEPGTDRRKNRMFDGIDLKAPGTRVSLNWELVDRLRKTITGKFVLKGVESGADAQLSLEHGIDGILVSNHGGRATETGRATLDELPEVLEAVNGRVPVLVDGGFRHGTDAFKALALGARAVGIGRPYLWGLGAFGEAGVEKVIDLVQREFRRTMAQCGTQTLAQINRTYIQT